MSPGVQSIADLTTETSPTSGEIPPPLVGASTIVVNNAMYVFGGRLVSSRQMTNHLYVLDLTTLVWRRHVASPDSTPAPQPRYFHSANTYKNHMVVFGGMSHSNSSNINNNNPQQELCALDDVCLLNLQTMTWTYPEIGPSIFSPQPRYAHLAVITTAQDKLVVMGGQDMANQYIKEINVLDLKTFVWIQGCPLEGQYGAYRSVICSPRLNDPTLKNNNSPFTLPAASSTSSTTSTSTGNNNPTTTTTTNPNATTPDDDSSNLPICVYSNYNFADVARDLQIFYPLRNQWPQYRDHSAEMSGASLPPGLRFPMGHLLGHHMILTGTYLTPTHRSFHIWALNLANLVWMRIDTGATFSSGSWNRGVLAEDDHHKFYVLGHRDRDLLEDYNRRQVNFDHIATVDMEAFGIYLHPPSTCAPIAQELGLSMLNEPSMSDIELITFDKKSIPANSSILSQRWPYFSKLMASPSASNMSSSGSNGSNGVEIGGGIQKSNSHPNNMNEHGDSYYKSLAFPENYPVALAFLQYIYTDHLMTAQQHQPHILSRLLILADMYQMPRLSQLATHALHQILTISTASMVYETAALTCRTALQIRALRVMINAKKMLQQQQQMMQQQQEHAEEVGRRPSYENPEYSSSFQRIPSQDSSEDPFATGIIPSSSGGNPTLRKLATSKSSTTHDLASSSANPPVPRMSKSGTMLSTHTHPPASVVSSTTSSKFRKGSITALHANAPPSPATKERPNIGIRF
ncbi:hypothetical protein BDA99DRAFT_515359 [Phascolomyces articulosus]|uniref:BTB domain-containing protein n=1 Tax=Phascolomyces articulosus TaxID=60185 RepID=A0AAD5K6K3_9FUNG|nr:hypothetical protein BDA99DRAFT_515359 [Phascolomyces articulosus]